MKKVYIHGLGQTSSSWNQVVSRLDSSDDSACINLADLFMEKKSITAIYIMHLQLYAIDTMDK